MAGENECHSTTYCTKLSEHAVAWERYEVFNMLGKTHMVHVCKTTMEDSLDTEVNTN